MLVIAESVGTEQPRVRPRRNRRSDSEFVDTNARRLSWSSAEAFPTSPVNNAAAFRKSSYPFGFGSGGGGGVLPANKKSAATMASAKMTTSANSSVRTFRGIADGQHVRTTGAVNDRKPTPRCGRPRHLPGAGPAPRPEPGRSG